MRRVLTTIAMILVCAAGAAQPVVETEETEYPRYTVEVIIFEYAEEVSVGTERFMPDEPPPAPDDLAEQALVFGDDLADAPVEDEGPELESPEFVLHPEDELTMTDVASRLERLDVYRPVMHFAWTQVTRPQEKTRPIDLFALAEPPAGLEGTFTLYLSRYLHLVVDLSLEQSRFADPVAIGERVPVYSDGRGRAGYDVLEPVPVRFRINEDRIFKSGDLRYFDHPKFGVLAQITRVEEAEEEDDEAGLVGQFGE